MRIDLLEVRREPGGERHYAGDMAIHAGDFIRAQIRGEWFDGRYEATWRFGIIERAFLYIGETALVLHEGTPVVVP